MFRSLLPNGKVLVAGGGNSVALNSAELYDPVTNSWTDAAPMAFEHFAAAAALLPNGTVLVAGGTNSANAFTKIILQEITAATAARGITVESAPLRRVTLPGGLSASIEQKLQSEQESQRMQFVLTKEKQEADRKRIEAQGISDFQKIVNQGLNQQLLTWKGIEATEKLANSPNSKIVVIGGGKTGLPLIFDAK